MFSFSSGVCIDNAARVFFVCLKQISFSELFSDIIKIKCIFHFFTLLALRIHLSENTRSLLEQWGTFVVERRGEVELKGRGRMITYWLLHCSEPETRSLSQGPQPPPQYPILFPGLPQPTLSLQVPYLVVDPPTLAA